MVICVENRIDFSPSSSSSLSISSISTLEAVSYTHLDVYKRQSVDSVKNEFKEVFKDVPASEIAEAERLLIAGGMPVEEIQRLCDVHASLFEGEVINDSEGFEMGHPLEVFKAENRGIEKFIDSELMSELKEIKSGSEDREKVKYLLTKLSKIDLHYSRKENRCV